MIGTLIILFAVACLYVLALYVRTQHEEMESARRDLWQPCGRRVNSLVDMAYNRHWTARALIEESNSYAFVGMHNDKTVLRDAALAVALRQRIEAEMAEQLSARPVVRATVGVMG